VTPAPAIAKKPAIVAPVSAPVKPTPKVETAKKPAPAPVQVAAQPTKKIEETPVVARREFPSVRNAFAKFGKGPLLVSRLKTWSTTPVEDWSDPSAVSNEKISPRKGFENVSKKIAGFGHGMKPWGGRSDVQTGSQVAANPPVEKQDATAVPTVSAPPSLERIKASESDSPTPKATPDKPSTWY
jgi:hypothetical protein